MALAWNNITSLKGPAGADGSATIPTDLNVNSLIVSPVAGDQTLSQIAVRDASGNVLGLLDKSGNLIVASATVNGALSTTGKATLASLATTGAAQLGASLSVAGQITSTYQGTANVPAINLGSNIGVSGIYNSGTSSYTLYFIVNGTTVGTIDANGLLTINGAISATGAISGPSLTLTSTAGITFKDGTRQTTAYVQSGTTGLTRATIGPFTFSGSFTAPTQLTYGVVNYWAPPKGCYIESINWVQNGATANATAIIQTQSQFGSGATTIFNSGALTGGATNNAYNVALGPAYPLSPPTCVSWTMNYGSTGTYKIQAWINVVWTA